MCLQIDFGQNPEAGEELALGLFWRDKENIWVFCLACGEQAGAQGNQTGGWGAQTDTQSAQNNQTILSKKILGCKPLLFVCEAHRCDMCNHLGSFGLVPFGGEIWDEKYFGWGIIIEWLYEDKWKKLWWYSGRTLEPKFVGPFCNSFDQGKRVENKCRN